MDLTSSLSDAQQLQQQYQEYQAQQQQQQNPDYYASQLYDPSQTTPQSHDQSNQAYYSYYQQPQQQQHQYSYYQPEYSTAYHHQESAPQIADSGGAGAMPVGAGQQSAAQPFPPGLNAAAAAAVAALSQLTQFAGTMGAAERVMAGFQGRGPGAGPFMGPGMMHHGQGSMRPPVGRSPYRGGGRKGGRPFRGGGQRNFGHHHPRSGGSGPPFRGRGRGRGRGGPRRFLHGVSLTSSHPEPSAAVDAELADEEAEPSADAPEGAAQDEMPPEASVLTQVQGNIVPNRRPQVAWCEICRVDCTSLEILEQHKNGKRHRKNLKKLEELKNAVKIGTDIQNEQIPTAKSDQEEPQKPEFAQAGEENTPMENLPSEAVSDENKEETEQRNNTVEQPEVPVQESSDLQGRKPRMDQFGNGRRGMKRKMRGSRGGKRMKTFEPLRRHIEPPKPKVVIPPICDLCNVKCDTPEVFSCHLSGKKHLAKLKRFEGHQAMYGPMGLQALYPPNPIAQNLFLPQGHQQPFYGPQSSFPPPGPLVPPQAHQAAPAAAGLDPQFQQYPKLQSEALPEYGTYNAVTVAPEYQQQAAIVELETRQATIEANPVNGI